MQCHFYFLRWRDGMRTVHKLWKYKDWAEPKPEGISFQPPSTNLGLECFCLQAIMQNKVTLSSSFWTPAGWSTRLFWLKTPLHSNGFNLACLFQVLLTCSAWPHTNSGNLIFYLVLILWLVLSLPISSSFSLKPVVYNCPRKTAPLPSVSTPLK